MAKEKEVHNPGMTIGKYLEKAYPEMSQGLKSIFLTKLGKVIKTEPEWAKLVNVELSRKIQ